MVMWLLVIEGIQSNIWCNLLDMLSLLYSNWVQDVRPLKCCLIEEVTLIATLQCVLIGSPLVTEEIHFYQNHNG